MKRGRAIDLYGLIFSVLICLLMILFTVYKVYWRVYESEQLVYPLEAAELLYLQSTTQLEQHFQQSHDGLSGVRILFPPIESTVSGELVVKIHNGEEGFTTTLKAAEIAQSPMVTIELPQESIRANRLLVMQLEWRGEQGAQLPLYIRVNPLLKKPDYLSTLYYEGQPRKENLVFAPVYPSIDYLVEGMRVDMRYEWWHWLYLLVYGRPEIIQWFFIGGLFGFYSLTGVFAYISWRVVMKETSLRQQKNTLFACMGLMLFMVLWL